MYCINTCGKSVDIGRKLLHADVIKVLINISVEIMKELETCVKLQSSDLTGIRDVMGWHV